MYDCIVVGAGPAGVIAAVQLRRSGRRILIIERDRVGGLLCNARCVSNYLAFPGGVSGDDMVGMFRKQMKAFSLSVQKEDVADIREVNGAITVYTDVCTYSARAVIIATGTKPKKAGIEGEESLHGTKLFYHIADLPRMNSHKNVLVIGGGDVGFDYALRLYDSGLVPTVITRGESKCIPILKEEIENRSIECIFGETPVCIRGTNDGIAIECSDRSYIADYVLIAVGREPNIPKHDKSAGIFVAGDANGGMYRQVHIASGDALRTAMEVHEYLSAKKSPVV